MGRLKHFAKRWKEKMCEYHQDRPKPNHVVCNGCFKAALDYDRTRRLRRMFPRIFSRREDV